MMLDFRPYNVDDRLRAAVEEVCDTQKRVRAFGDGGTAIWIGYVSRSADSRPVVTSKLTDRMPSSMNWAGVARLEYTNADNGGLLYDRNAPSLAEELEAIEGLQRVLDEIRLVPSAATEPNDDKETPGA